jgi:nicotinate-nucleotide--dimethylbenzimidazole phosphoribosyltransferase
VTRIVADNCAAGRSTVNILARRTGTEVFVIDVGMNGPEYPEKELRPGSVVSRRIRNGSGNIAKESAMTKEECRQAMETGREVLCRIKELGYSIVSLGEMGIGNTTPTAVLAGLLLEMDAPEVTGYGAGLSREGLDRKIRAVQKAMDRIRAKQDLSEETMLREGGGMELAAMTGLLLEAEAQNVPVVLDGAITLAAALVAVRMDPRVRRILIASHDPQEPAGHRILEKLALPAVIRGDLSLGEGTGAMLLMPMLEAVQDVYESMGSFEEIRVKPYERYQKGETLC